MKEIKSSKIKVVLNWDKRHTSGKEFDIDLACLLLNSKNKVSKNKDLVFFNNKKSSDLAVILDKDSNDGEDEVDEQISIDLSILDNSVESILFVVSIFEENGNLNFGQISNVNALILGDISSDNCSLNLSEEVSVEKIIIPFEIIRIEDKFYLKDEFSLVSSSFEKLIQFFGVGIKK